MSDFLGTRGRNPGQRVIDALGNISSALMADEPNIADKICERRAGTEIVGVIALNTGTAGAAFSPA